MNISRRKLALIVTPFLIVALLSTGLAAYTFMVSRQVNNTMSVTLSGDVALLRYDNMQPVTSINWGDFNSTSGWTKNSNDTNVLNTIVLIKNTGDLSENPGWNVTNLPAGFTITCQDREGIAFPQNFFDQFNLPPGSANGYLFFTLTRTSAVSGSYSFTLNIIGAGTS